MDIKFIRQQVLQGQCHANYQKIKAAIIEAKQEGVKIIVFQSNCIAGVFLDEYIQDANFYEKVISYNEKIKNLAKDILVVWGNVYNHTQAILIAKDDYFEVVYKPLKNEALFNESKYYKAVLPTTKIIEVDNKKIEIQYGRLQPSNHFVLYFDEYYTDKTFELKNGVIINHFGFESINKSLVVFDGTIQKFDNGQCFKNNQLHNQSFNLNIPIYHTTLLEKIVFAFKNYDEIMFNKNMKWVIGLSGGLDSSVCAAIACLALGKERIIGYNMATQHNTASTKNIAKHIATALNIEYHEGEITPIVDATLYTMQQYGYNVEKDLVKQNIQARVRGHLLSSFAAENNAVIINNGNKVETALGYATLYGDLIGAFSPIADITKVQLFDLSKQINHQFEKEVIPQSLLPIISDDEIFWQQKPSAELAQGQFDPMKWFYHDYIIGNLGIQFTIPQFIDMYDQKKLPKDVQKWIKYYGLDVREQFITDIEWLVATMQKNKFKLLQAPPMLVLTNNAYSSNRAITQFNFIE